MDQNWGRCTRERRGLEFSSRIMLALQAKVTAPYYSCNDVCTLWHEVGAGEMKEEVLCEREERVIKTCIISTQIRQNRIFRAHFLGDEISKREETVKV